MTPLPHMMVLITVFALMLTVVNLVPPVFLAFHQRYKDKLSRTTREMDKFFVHIKVTHIVAAAIVLGGFCGFMMDSWPMGVAVALASTVAPRMILSLWKEIRSSQVEAQLMDALILMNNALKSGLDIATGIELIVNNMTPPISEEFNLVLN